jgi:hypothetical protein
MLRVALRIKIVKRLFSNAGALQLPVCPPNQRQKHAGQPAEFCLEDWLERISGVGNAMVC